MAESHTIAASNFGPRSFNISEGPYSGARVNVEVTKGLPSDAWDQVRSNQLFNEWAARFCSEGCMRLKSITIRKVRPEICMDVEATSGGERVVGPVVLRPLQSSVLVVLRNTHSQHEVCIFSKRPDLHLGISDSFGLIEGSFDADGKLCGPCASLLEEHFQITIRREDVVDLSLAVHGKSQVGAGLLFCPSHVRPRPFESASSPVRTELLLYIGLATPQQLARLEGNVGPIRPSRNDANIGIHQKSLDLSLSAVHMSDAWRMVLDSRAMIALYLVNESRQHNVKLTKPAQAAELGGANQKNHVNQGGPKRTPKKENDAVEPANKAAARFRKISSLQPMCMGVNLRVKVVEPIERQPDLVLPRGQVVRRGTLVVGDDNAIITVSLEGSQLNLPDVVNTPLLIRNGRVKMENGHMRLVVDRWGKITDAKQEDIANFNFSVCTLVDMSAMEYELVEIPDGEQDPINKSGSVHTSTSKPASAGVRPANRSGRRRQMKGSPVVSHKNEGLAK